MNKTDSGIKVINQIVKCLQITENESEKPLTQSIQKLPQSQSTKCNHQITITKKKNDLRTRILKITPSLCFNHIHKLFGIIGINQTAISTQNFQQSLLMTQFYGRTIQKIQFYRNAIVIDIAPPDSSEFNLKHEQISERFKSLGDDKFYRLALQIMELSNTFLTLISSFKNSPKDKNESITQFLDAMGDSMFFIKFGMNKVALSKNLLQYLNYDVENFAVEAIKYGTILNEIFSSNSYYIMISHIIKIFKHLVELISKAITLEEFKILSTLNFYDYIYSKNYEKSYCEFSMFVPTPSIFCLKITSIVYKSNELQWQPSIQSKRKLLINTEKINMRKKEYYLYDKLQQIESKKVATYQMRKQAIPLCKDQR